MLINVLFQNRVNLFGNDLCNYQAPWGSGTQPFLEKEEKKMFAFLKSLKKNHEHERSLLQYARPYDSLRQLLPTKPAVWRGHEVDEEFKLSVTFKTSDLWNQQ